MVGGVFKTKDGTWTAINRGTVLVANATKEEAYTAYNADVIKRAAHAVKVLKGNCSAGY